MKKREWSDEMISDLYQIGDVEFSKKYNISRPAIIRERKMRCIKSFNNKHGLISHKIIDGIEYKLCAFGHWESISNFGKHCRNYDGLRHWCKKHEAEKNKHYYHKNNRNEYNRQWRHKPENKERLSLTWKRAKSKKYAAYVFWDSECDRLILWIFGNRCPYCGSEENLELEHFIPISKGGKTEPGNCYYACSGCNHGDDGKFDKMPLEWLISKYGITCGMSMYNAISGKLKEHRRYYDDLKQKP